MKYEHPACSSSRLLLAMCNFSLGKAGSKVGLGEGCELPCWKHDCLGEKMQGEEKQHSSAVKYDSHFLFSLRLLTDIASASPM